MRLYQVLVVISLVVCRECEDRSVDEFTVLKWRRLLNCDSREATCPECPNQDCDSMAAVTGLPLHALETTKVRIKMPLSSRALAESVALVTRDPSPISSPAVRSVGGPRKRIRLDRAAWQ